MEWIKNYIKVEKELRINLFSLFIGADDTYRRFKNQIRIEIVNYFNSKSRGGTIFPLNE